MAGSGRRRVRVLVLSLIAAVGVGSGVLPVLPAPTVGAAAAAGVFVGLTPTRVLDTREPGQGSCLAAGAQRSLTVAGAGGVPADASAVVLNVTATEPTSSGFLTVYPAGVARPNASNLNFTRGQTVPNAVTVKVGSGGAINLFNNSGCTHAIVDVVGYYTGGSPVAAHGFVGLTPARALDTRVQGGCLAGGMPRSFPIAGTGGVPADASAVVLNVTVTEPTGNGFLTVYPAGVGRPNASNLNFTTGQTVPNAVTVKVGSGGAVNLFNSGGCTHVIVDVVGYFAGGSPVAAGGFMGLTPARVLDTREAGQGPCLAGGVPRALTVAGAGGVPADASAVVLNVTVTQPTGNGFLTVYPAGVTRPNASNLNFTAGQTVPNAATVKLGSGGAVNLFNSSGCTHTIVDVVGYYTGAAPVVAGSTQRVSVDPDGGNANSDSQEPAVSGDGRYVTYSSYAADLVPGDTNRKSDVFVFDRQTAATARVSLASGGAQADGDSLHAAISTDGRYITYASSASNLVPGDTNATTDVFVFDRQTAATTRVSVASNGAQANDGANLSAPAISADGRYITYASDSSNLVPGDTNGTTDVFVFDRVTATTTRVSVASDGTQANSFSLSPGISGDGRYVVYESDASNLVPIDTNLTTDVFVFDRQTAATTRVSVASGGTQANSGSSSSDVSGDGRYVSYVSSASNLVPGDSNSTTDVFVFDRQTAATTRVSVASGGTQANDASFSGGISADGRYVTYTSSATNLVSGDTNGADDVFVFDRQTATTTRVSIRSDGTQANDVSFSGGISADGRYVTYTSSATNLVSGDTNVWSDVFVFDRLG